jgi:hypothetical protein
MACTTAHYHTTPGSAWQSVLARRWGSSPFPAQAGPQSSTLRSPFRQSPEKPAQDLCPRTPVVLYFPHEPKANDPVKGGRPEWTWV